MSDTKNISPLLDGYTLGSQISEHHGVICFPAIKENTNKKFIVKKITVPATQAQFDALLLAGAYKDPGDAMEYFQGCGENILQEAEILKKLSKLEGFLPYDGWQMEPITRRRLGYEVYLVGSYKRSLDKYIRKNAFTHLEAVNLGLDLCSALSVCRQSGYLYVDLKPSNIYVSEKKEYRIGDLGFIGLDTLRYASLPERYFSAYTPPELLDPMAAVNLSVDTYAVGMILYQLYNDGHLPFTGVAPLEEMPAPCQADYEMAEIIMKAIHPDPEQRWLDPKDLGKAIAAYMQRNSVNDVPITAFTAVEIHPEDIVPAPAEQPAEDTEAAVANADPEVEASTDNTEIADKPEESSSVEEESEELLQEMTEESVVEEEISEVAEAVEASIVVEVPEEAPEVLETTDAPADQPSEEEPKEEENSLEDISEEVAKIITKANDIIAHEIPEEISFPMNEEKPDPFAFVREDTEELEDTFPADPLIEEETDDQKAVSKKKTRHFADPTRKNKIKKFFSRLLTFIILAGAAAGGFWYYQNIYLQPIDGMSITGTQSEITVLVDTGIEETKLTVHCIDKNGKRRSAALQGGKASFSDLKPSTEYTIQLEMDGFHSLTGNATAVYTTDATTQILDFQAMAGSEDGSVKLEFTVDGSDPDFWNIRYSTEGEEELQETVTGHSATITGLTIGKTYTFTLDGGKNFDVGGETSVQYLASRLVLADNFTITSSDGSDITVHWTTPGDVVVESWNVRCYDGYGFEEVKTVTENIAVFTGLESDSHYTIEVTAAGMTQPARLTISYDPINVSEFIIDESDPAKLKISWAYTGADPENGWLLRYTVDGSGTQEIPCTKASAEIIPLIPGANYKFVLEAADERTVFNNTLQHKTMEAEAFNEHNFDIQNVAIDLLNTPEEAEWNVETITEDIFTNRFTVGDSASLAFRSSSAIYVPSNKTKVLFVFRDAYGNVLPELVTEISCVWKSIWTKGDVKTGELDIPALPSATGEYVMELYFNGSFVQRFDITMTD